MKDVLEKIYEMSKTMTKIEFKVTKNKTEREEKYDI